MAPPPWTTKEQAAFLEERKYGFLEAQTARHQTQFFATLYEEWFTRWPARESIFPTLNGEFARPLTESEVEEVQKHVVGTKNVRLLTR